ncbi:MAG TPA: DinB family protein [Parafilimonas sp.]|nr:DinB family protein [Parafilimonas sp.]
MNQHDIAENLERNYRAFTGLIISLNEEQFLFTKDNKWSAGQQAEHILRSVKAVNLGFTLPRFVLKISFGASNRPSKTFDALVERYKEKLAAGGKSSARYIPKAVAFHQRKNICEHIVRFNESICNKLNSYSEIQLDTYILPHPLLGKLTLREMLYFNIHHVKHHEINVRELLRL